MESVVIKINFLEPCSLAEELIANGGYLNLKKMKIKYNLKNSVFP